LTRAEQHHHIFVTTAGSHAETASQAVREFLEEPAQAGLVERDAGSFGVAVKDALGQGRAVLGVCLRVSAGFFGRTGRTEAICDQI
jgi:hypothetical protein